VRVVGLRGARHRRQAEPWWTGTFDIDDPRWTGASGHSTGQYGAAANVIDARTTWANEGGRDFLYLSWVIHVDSSIPGANHCST